MFAARTEPQYFSERMPWRDEASARRALSKLADFASGTDSPTGWATDRLAVNRRALSAWLTHHDFAALGFAAALPVDTQMASELRDAAVGAAAGNLAHFETLLRIERRFESEHIPMVLLKGAAVAFSAYRDPSLRPMSDIDIWVRDEDMPRATEQLRELGLRQESESTDRPDALQRRSGGEIAFHHGRREHGRVELHFGAFQGWWVRRAAAVDMDAVWRRAEPLGPNRHALRLAAEDAILQTAFHVVVNQFCQAPLRGLMDLAVLARACTVRWEAVVERARDWRLATSMWLALQTADRLAGLPGGETAIAQLRPTTARRASLRAFVTPCGILSGRDLARTARRHLLMLALVDRPRDAARLLGRTVWPESWWIAARYGRPVSRVEHLWELVRRKAV